MLLCIVYTLKCFFFIEDDHKKSSMKQKFLFDCVFSWLSTNTSKKKNEHFNSLEGPSGEQQVCGIDPQGGIVKSVLRL